MECARADKMDAGRVPAELWSHCLMAIVAVGQMVFLDSRAVLKTGTAEVTRLRFTGFPFFFLMIKVGSS